MKKLAFLFSMIVLAIVATAQVPQAFKYQTVVRDKDGQILPNLNVAFRISIHESTAKDNIIYQETHSVTTNQSGLVNLEIGRGSPTIGTFEAIDWTCEVKLLEIEIDPVGGREFIEMGTTELVSVPYAMHAETVTNVDDADADSTNELQYIFKEGSLVTLSDDGGSFIDEVDDADADSTNEIQTISKVDSLVMLSDGGSFIDEVNDADADPTNELNNSVVLDGTNLKVTDAGGTITTDLNSLVDDADADPGNELQTVSKVGSTVTLSDGGGFFTDEVDDADADPTNETNTSVVLDGTDLKITDAAGTITADLSTLVDDADANPTNELQTLSIVGNDLTISNGNMVPLPTNMPVGTAGQTINHDGTDWVASSNLFNDGTNVGIGTTTPGSKLDADGDIRGNRFVDRNNTAYYLDPASENASAIFNGRVGIGGEPFWYNSGPPFNSGWGPNLHVHEGAAFADVWIGKSQDTVGNEIGRLAFVGHASNMFPAETIYAGITAKINNSGINHAGSLLFYTATGEGIGGEPYKEQMRLTNLGRLGIGTSNPAAKLDVDGTINTSDAYKIEENTVLSTPGSNTFLGIGSGENNSDGSLNTFLGYYAGKANTDGDGNTFVGRMSGTNNSIGHSNTFIGDETAEANTTGSENTYVGKSAGVGSNGSGNVFLGHAAGAFETGSNKFYVANGYEDGDVLISGDFSTGNVGIGLGTTSPTQKLDVNGVVKANSFLGSGSSLTNLNASSISTGTLDNNRFNALDDLGGGSGTTFLRKDGIWTTPNGTTYSAGNDLALNGTTFSLENDIDVNYVRGTSGSGLKLFDDGGNGIYIRDGGNVGIGVSDPEYGTLCVHAINSAGLKMTNDGTGSGYNDGFLLSWMSGGNSAVVLWNRENTPIAFATNNSERMRIKENGYVGIGSNDPQYKLHVNGTAYATGAAGALSDRRHKTKIVSLEESVLDEIGKLRPVSYEWKDPLDDGMIGTQLGFIAQEVEKVFPDMVLTQNNEEKTKALKYNEFIPILVKAVQELKAENEDLKLRLDKLEGK